MSFATEIIEIPPLPGIKTKMQNRKFISHLPTPLGLLPTQIPLFRIAISN
jgi:hypothetical protein